MTATVGGAGAEPTRVVPRLNPANAVTASRYLTLPPLYYAIAHDHHQWATVLIIICGLLDKVDGFAAKLFDCRSAFGEMFDAITDGICYGFALVLLGVFGWAPPIAVALIIVMGLANSAMRGIYVKRVGHTANYKSYGMERVVAYTAYLVGFGTAGYEVKFYFWLFVPVMLIVLVHDTKRMLIDPVPRDGA